MRRASRSPRRSAGLPATVVMPANAPLAKQAATRGYGAEVVLLDGSIEACIARARELAAELDLLFVPPFDNPAVVAGQATVGLELLDQAPEAETVIVPAGGGGLLAGVALAIKSLRPEVRVIGAQAQAMPGIAASLDAGSPLAVPLVQTLADGAAVAGPSELTFDLIRRYADEVVTVPEAEIEHAMVLLIERTNFVVEGAGALGIAALLSGAVEASGPVAVVLSGGNVDINLLGRIVERGLTGAGRRRLLTFAAAHAPGELARISAVIAGAGANVIQVDHKLTGDNLPIGLVLITFHLDVSGEEGLRAAASGAARGRHAARPPRRLHDPERAGAALVAASAQRDLVDLRELGGVEAPVRGGDVLLDLLAVARARDDAADVRLRGEPADRQVDERVVTRARERLEAFEPVPGGGGGRSGSASVATSRSACPRARLRHGGTCPSGSTREREVGQHAHARREAGGDEVRLDAPVEHVVLGLRRDERRELGGVDAAGGLGDAPALEVRAADVPHLAVAHEVVEGAQRLVERRRRVRPVQLVEVDVVRAEPPQ